MTNSPADIAASFELSKIDRTFLDDPFPTYAALRTHDPVHRSPDGSYFLTRYGDVMAVYHDSRARFRGYLSYPLALG
jgi:hypothetical protein